MYNMNISILGYKLSLEILILIGVVYLILVTHTICGCCNVGGIMEGLATATSSSSTKSSDANAAEREKIRKNIKARQAATATTAATTAATPAATPSATEGFTGANTNYGESSLYTLGKDTPINTSSWNASNMSVIKGQPLNPAVKSILNRPTQPVPLPDGELLLFANTEFKQECCPNSFSTSTGCACMTTDQYNYLVLRGGNNVPYSEY
jgi:hypothetical protein